MTRLLEILNWNITNPIPQTLEALGIRLPTVLALVVAVVLGVVAIVDSVLWRKKG